ncbi:acetoacetate--CoA ligase [Bradyrhizobium sp. CB82]|uniref:acetoacetate--CoA ligase n=1 Tax=Bradyrhizobium sp. CB82 TaxID=3039159 RepID=UPI0024B15D70|nr:acetoacetate--CoA ligase [Bradyrhizobium sp. CB82]WFU44627.1 acetoacetate--CoA ligase [Bradyrhizobium sp. CB82]
MKATATLELLWTPSEDKIVGSRLWDYMGWLDERQGRKFEDYEDLWRWSTSDLNTFWGSIWDYFDVRADGDPTPVLQSDAMPGVDWFPNTRLNYAEHIFRAARPVSPALVVLSETGEAREVSWEALRQQTAALAATLRRLGIKRGDRVAAYLPNRPETVVALLACASIGAIWSSCSPEMGRTMVLDRFSQIEPKVLFAADSYTYNGKTHDRAPIVEDLREGLPSVGQIIHVPGPLAAERPIRWRNVMSWGDAVSGDAELQFDRVPFSHPLWIVYSSGTTGLPKGIVHGHGGIVLTHLKTMSLQHDLRPGERLMFLASTGWIVWNLQVGALLTGASIVLYDGNPAWPDNRAIWKLLDAYDVTHFGCGAAFLTNCMKDGLRPEEFVALEKLRSISSTGSPLPVEAYRWVYDAIKSDIWLASISGGTDIASGFVSCSPVLPVHAGEIQCRELGVAAFAFNEAGEPVIDEVGELVIVKPMPSMPIFFWNDEGGRRYQESYFEQFPGRWRHGDWIRFSAAGTSQIYGRSDTTINRFGIRIGTAEIYRVVEDIAEIRDSLVVDLEYLGRESYMPLFVVLQPGLMLTDELKARIATQIRTYGSARHVPSEIFQVEEIPRTLTGKKMELPVRKLLLGTPAERVASPDSMANPASLEYFVRFAEQLNLPQRV